MVHGTGPNPALKDLVVPDAGQLLRTDDPWEPYRLLGPEGECIAPAMEFLTDLQAAGSPATTLRSYGMDLLRWWRFLWALEVVWDRAGREHARDFALWMQLADKPVRTHWRHRGADRSVAPRPAGQPVPGAANPVTGKPSRGPKYSPSTRAHAETVLRSFYDFHLEQHSGALLLNPFPLVRARRGGRANANHNPMDDFRRERTGRYRPKVPKRTPRRMPDEKYSEVFAGLRSHRDRALLAFWVSTGARASELLGACQEDAHPGEQVIGVIRKGTRDYQQLPASPEAFVWLRLYQEESWRKGVPRGRSQPLWCTLRRPWRELTYDAARAMFNRANQVLGANWTLHDLRHTASHRMANDPEMPIQHVQLILGHARLTTTQTYVAPTAQEAIEQGLAHLVRQERRRTDPLHGQLAPGYDPQSLNTLFGGAR